MRRNKLRELLVAEKPSFSTRVHSTWPSVVEIIGHTGMFDYVEFVAEYAPYDLYDLDNMCRAAELHDEVTGWRRHLQGVPPLSRASATVPGMLSACQRHR